MTSGDWSILTHLFAVVGGLHVLEDQQAAHACGMTRGVESYETYKSALYHLEEHGSEMLLCRMIHVLSHGDLPREFRGIDFL